MVFNCFRSQVALQKGRTKENYQDRLVIVVFSMKNDKFHSNIKTIESRIIRWNFAEL